MAYPPFELECSACRHRWTSTAAPGASIKCPACLKRGEVHTRRMPADRPRTAAQARAVAAAADDDDGLAAAWQAEESPVRWRDCLGPEGAPCSKCGKPTRWVGAHTALICLGHDRPLWSVSPGAKTRAAEHLAAIDKSAARKSAQLADPEAERIAADAFEARRAELLDDLDGLADALDVTGFPRGNSAYEPARRAGLQYGAIVARYIGRVRHADTLDQLDRIDSDAARSFASIADGGGWLDRIADLRDQLDHGPGKMVRGEVIYGDQADDDGDQADDDDYDPWADRAARQIREARERAAITNRAAIAAAQPGGLRTGGIAPVLGTYCEWCKRDRRYVGATYPLATARIEAPGMVPAPVDVCADHLAAARQQYGAALHVHDQFWAAYDRSVAALGSHQAIEYAKAAAQPRRNVRALPWRRGA